MERGPSSLAAQRTRFVTVPAQRLGCAEPSKTLAGAAATQEINQTLLLKPNRNFLLPVASKALTRKEQNHCPGAGERDPENQGFQEQRLQNMVVGKLPAPPSQDSPGACQEYTILP